MNINSLVRYVVVALSFVGSAILLFSCESTKVVSEDVNLETLMTEYSENMSITMSENGLKSYHFETPLIEGYAMAKDPHKEFRKGIKITMFEKDSLQSTSATLVANYAIFYEDRKLWEAKGDVKVEQLEGRKLFTSQLFWNQVTHKIYSNVDCKIVQGDQVYYCEGFESDEQMKDWSYRKVKGVTYFDDTEFQNSSAEQSEVAATTEGNVTK
ncbi:MAG: LPS export ABC transporter periplasmic protein LptC [Alistipes sp.]|nr:LPS export ABC transporter periplasmic protein LptC [Alistipes sp.]